MSRKKAAISIIFCLSFFQFLAGQKAEFNGQAALWGTINSSGGTGYQTGAKYLPVLAWEVKTGKKFKLDGEISADLSFNYTRVPNSAGSSDASVSAYRFWLRFSGERFELRGGLQKINFGSASMLRPLMWFDRVDPRDPLRLTKGVYGFQGKYFFKNNASIWLWTLIGNKNTKGWEMVPTKPSRPEFGGRIQLPIPRGEMALSYHNREARFPDDWNPPVAGNREFNEQRIGYDVKADPGVGLWIETCLSHLDQKEFAPFTRSAAFGADYTLGILNGLSLTVEHMLYTSSDKAFSKGESFSLTGFSAGAPLSVITRINTIFFYDWKNKGLYRFANLSFTFDKLALNLIGFWNPDQFSLFNYGQGPNLFSGYGGQVMIVYNH